MTTKLNNQFKREFFELCQDNEKASFLGKCWRYLYHSAKRRDLLIQLSKTQYIYLLSFNCHWCNQPLNGIGINLDRQNESKGYEIRNVFPSCKVCNVKKYNRSQLIKNNYKFR